VLYRSAAAFATNSAADSAHLSKIEGAEGFENVLVPLWLLGYVYVPCRCTRRHAPAVLPAKLSSLPAAAGSGGSAQQSLSAS
jgi:hypothetical protein